MCVLIYTEYIYIFIFLYVYIYIYLYIICTFVETLFLSTSCSHIGSHGEVCVTHNRFLSLRPTLQTKDMCGSTTSFCRGARRAGRPQSTNQTFYSAKCLPNVRFYLNAVEQILSNPVQVANILGPTH